MNQKCKILKSLKGEEIDNLYDLLYHKALTDSELKTPYKMYYYLIENNVDKAYEKFLNSFETIVEKAPISVANDIRNILSKHNDDKRLVNLILKNKRLSSLIFTEQKNTAKI